MPRRGRSTVSNRRQRAALRSRMADLREGETPRTAARRRERNRSSMETSRTEETPRTAAWRRERNRSSMETSRTEETPRTAARRLEADRSHHSELRSAQTPRTAAAERAALRSRMADLREGETPRTAAWRRERNRSSMETSRTEETPRTAARRLEADRSHHSELRSAQTPRTAAAERAALRSRMADLREGETPRTAARRQEADRSRHAELRSEHSPRTAAAEAQRQRERMSRSRSNLSSVDRTLEAVRRRSRRRTLFESSADTTSGILGELVAEDIMEDHGLNRDGSSESSFDIFGGFEQMKEAVKLFEANVSAFDYPPIACSVCSERYPVPNPSKFLDHRQRCQRCRRGEPGSGGNKNSVYKFSDDNEMDPGAQVPDELQGLTNTEEMLISAVLPLMVVYNLPHGQRGYRGHIICFPQDVTSVASSLPRCIDQLDVLVVRRTYSNNTHRDFRVRRSRVETALRWLIQHNEYYHGIVIDEESLSQLPEDGNVHDSLRQHEYNDDDDDDEAESEQVPGIGEQDDGSLRQRERDDANEPEPEPEENEDENEEEVDDEEEEDDDDEGEEDEERACDDEIVHEQADDEGEQYAEAVGETTSYIPEVVRTRRHADVVEDEVNDLQAGTSRSAENQRAVPWPELGSEPIDEMNTVGYIVRAFPTLFPRGKADLREARSVDVTPKEYFKHLMLYDDPRFAQHDRFRYFAENSVRRWECLQKGNIYIQQNPGDAMLTAQDLKEMSRDDKRAVVNRMTHFAKSIRGTDKWWSTRKGELQAMCDQMPTLPTVFFTLSAADLHWPDLHRLMPPNSRGDRGTAVRMNPLLCVRFFLFRVKEYLSTVMKVMGMKDYWGRFEFQHRGSVHWHGVAWFEDSPDVTAAMKEGPEGEKQLVQYFDKE